MAIEGVHIEHSVVDQTHEDREIFEEDTKSDSIFQKMRSYYIYKIKLKRGKLTDRCLNSSYLARTASTTARGSMI